MSTYFSLLQKILQFRKNRNTSPQNPMYIGNQCSIVGERNASFRRQLISNLNHTRLQHTSAAVNNHPIRGLMIRKRIPRSPCEIKRFSCVCLYPVRQLDRSDVVALSVIRAAFRNQNLVVVLQIFQRSGGSHCLLQYIVIMCI